MQFSVQADQHLGYFYDQKIFDESMLLAEDKKSTPAPHFSYAYVADKYKDDLIQGNVAFISQGGYHYRQLSLRPYIEDVIRQGNILLHLYFM